MTGGLYRYKARLMPWGVRGVDTFDAAGSAWHDGDTFNALVSFGCHDYRLTHVRCAGFDAPELKTGAPGAASAAFARGLVEAGGVVILDSSGFTTTDEQDDFGRMLAAVTLPDGRDLAAVMLAAGQAVPD